MKTFGIEVIKVIEDAKEALRFDRHIEFKEWYPAWMVDENGELMKDPKRVQSLRMIFDRVKEELGID